MECSDTSTHGPYAAVDNIWFKDRFDNNAEDRLQCYALYSIMHYIRL